MIFIVYLTWKSLWQWAVFNKISLRIIDVSSYPVSDLFIDREFVSVFLDVLKDEYSIHFQWNRNSLYHWNILLRICLLSNLKSGIVLIIVIIVRFVNRTLLISSFHSFMSKDDEKTWKIIFHTFQNKIFFWKFIIYRRSLKSLVSNISFWIGMKLIIPFLNLTFTFQHFEYYRLFTLKDDHRDLCHLTLFDIFWFIHTFLHFDQNSILMQTVSGPRRVKSVSKITYVVQIYREKDLTIRNIK